MTVKGVRSSWLTSPVKDFSRFKASYRRRIDESHSCASAPTSSLVMISRGIAL